MRRGRRGTDGTLRRVVLLMAAVAVGLCGQNADLSAQADAFDPVEPLVGCWAGTLGDIELRESWTSSEGGLMLGTTRFFRDGRVVDFEFARIQAEDGVPTLWPYPRGTISERGFPLARSGDEIVFENLEHDFPVRIIYAFQGPDTIAPRIEGQDGNGRGWSVTRVACEG